MVPGGDGDGIVGKPPRIQDAGTDVAVRDLGHFTLEFIRGLAARLAERAEIDRFATPADGKRPDVVQHAEAERLHRLVPRAILRERDRAGDLRDLEAVTPDGLQS